MKTVSKLALAVTLMMGNIEFNTTQTDFYEDDSDFLQVSSVLETGWGWSLNKAYANDNCSGKEGSELQACEEEEVIEVIGTRVDDDDFDWNAGDDDRDDQATNNENGGGASDGDNQLSEQEKMKRAILQAECLAEAQSLAAPCIFNATQELMNLKITCDLISGVYGWFNRWAGLGAAAACAWGYRYDIGATTTVCNDNVREAEASCY